MASKLFGDSGKGKRRRADKGKASKRDKVPVVLNEIETREAPTAPGLHAFPGTGALEDLKTQSEGAEATEPIQMTGLVQTFVVSPYSLTSPLEVPQDEGVAKREQKKPTSPGQQEDDPASLDGKDLPKGQFRRPGKRRPERERVRSPEAVTAIQARMRQSWEQSGLSLAELGDIMGIEDEQNPKMTVYRFLNEYDDLPFTMVLRFCMALKLQLSDIVPPGLDPTK
jgi:hypothetical protein